MAKGCPDCRDRRERRIGAMFGFLGGLMLDLGVEGIASWLF